jgi:TfuA protein
MKTIIFFGPSITKSEVDDLVEAAHAPPIKRGDLDRVDDYDVVVILDGEFGQNLSVSPKEIMAILNRGKVVIGASSMGALRASELDRCGMMGVGWLYDHFRHGAVRRDDDVALVWSPIDFRPMTVPMVDVEYWMELVSTAGMIDGKDKARLLRIARGIFFADRAPETLMGALHKGFGTHAIEAFLEFSGGAIPSIKNIDAKKAIRFAASVNQSGALPPAAPERDLQLDADVPATRRS